MIAFAQRLAQTAVEGGGLANGTGLPPLPGSDHGLLALGAAILLLVACMVGFAATASVLRYRNRRKARYWQEREERWEGPLLDVLSGAVPPAALWELVREGEELYFIDYLLRFARRTRGSTRHVLEELARPYLGPVVERMSGGDPERRARAVETVAMLGFGPFGGGVLAALEDPSPLVAMIAARSIARHQRAEHVGLLLAQATRLSNWSPRQLTAVLVSMGAAATPQLRGALAHPGVPPGMRAVAADALRELHDPDAMPAAEKVLAEETDRDLLAAALRLIAELGSAAQAPHVRRLVNHDDPVIRSAALHALTTTGERADDELLQRSMADASGWVAIQAARALKHTGNAASLRAIARGEDPRSLLARQVLLESA